MSAPDKLTNEEVAPHGWVLWTEPNSIPHDSVALRVGCNFYIPAKREPRVFEGTIADLHRFGLNGPIGWRSDTRVRVIESLEEETQ